LLYFITNTHDDDGGKNGSERENLFVNKFVGDAGKRCKIESERTEKP
jgi:hypothetical protein